MENPGFEDSRLEAILSRLEKVKRQGTGYVARCPAHEDKDPSLSVGTGRSGILFHCWAGCTADSIRVALDLPWSALFWEGKQPETKNARLDRRGMELEAIMAAERLQGEPGVLATLRARRGWAGQALGGLGIGWDGRRLTIPVKDGEDRMHDVLRYDPLGPPKWKMLAGKGRSRLPWPRPESLEAGVLWLVEGEGSVISMASVGLKAVALPGSISKPSGDTSRPAKFQGVGWHPAWAKRFKHFPRIVCIPDCDSQGRNLMTTASYDLQQQGLHVTTVDLGFDRGFDVGDLLAPAKDGVTRKHIRDWLLMMDRLSLTKQNQLGEGREMLKDWFAYMTEQSAPEETEPDPASTRRVERVEGEAIAW